MSGIGLNLGILATVFIALGIGIWLAIIYFSKEEEEGDNPLVINFMADNCDGRAILVQKKVVIGKDGRRITTASPRDIFNKDVKDVEDVQIITDKNKTISIPKGVWSRDRNINLLLPPSASAFPSSFKATLFGKWMMFITQIQDAENSELEAFAEGFKRQSEHIKKIGMGELSGERINQLEEYFNEALDVAKESRKDKGTSSPFNPIHSGNPGGM